MVIKLLINMSNFRLNHVHIRLRYTDLFISFILIRNNRYKIRLYCIRIQNCTAILYLIFLECLLLLLYFYLFWYKLYLYFLSNIFVLFSLIFINDWWNGLIESKKKNGSINRRLPFSVLNIWKRGSASSYF